MMQYLDADKEESISYGNFQNFMILLPHDRLQDDPRNIWFKAVNVVAVVPPVEVHAGSVLRSAWAGDLSCAFSAFMMHHVDTIKPWIENMNLRSKQGCDNKRSLESPRHPSSISSIILWHFPRHGDAGPV